MLAASLIENFHDQVADLDDEEKCAEFLLVLNEKFTEEQILTLEKKIDCPFPEDLRVMLQSEGVLAHQCFADMWNTLELDSFEQLINKNFGLIDYIRDAWGGRKEFDAPQNQAYCTAENQAYLNSHYFVFGYRYVDDNVHIYFYFDREGAFGTFEFDQDMLDGIGAALESLADGNGGDMSLEELLTEQLDEIVESID
jgi:hypothetical protein